MADPISQSGLWKIQQDYYRDLGVAAWDDKTPYHLTNSQVFTDTYADLIVAYLQDHPPNLEQPLYLLELGSGTGRFAYQLVRDLRRKLQYFPELSPLRFCLVLSDIVRDNLEFWKTHERLNAVADSVDFSILEPGREDCLFLEKAGQRLHPGANPLFVLANYVFDSMPHDEFRFSPQGLEECLVELMPLPNPKHSTPSRLDIRDVEVRRIYAPLSERYTPQLQAVLDHYASRLREGAFTIPVAALECLERLRQLGSLILLSSDRGFTAIDRMTVYPAHPYSLHEGCFSHMVNYHALSLGFRTALMTRRELLDGVQTCLMGDFVLGPQLRYAFEERFARTNALNHANEMFAPFRGKTNLRTLLGFLRLNLNDPNALAAVGKQIPQHMVSYSYGERLELLAALEDIWANDFYFRGAPNSTFWLAHIYDALHLWDRALWFYEKTAERQGVDAMLLVFQAGCLQRLNLREQAIVRYNRALELVPEMPEATEGLRSLVGN
mgnify:CR=1 FL=1